MDIRDADTNELMLELNDDFTIEKSHSPEVEILWSDWLENGIIKLHPPSQEPSVVRIVDASRIHLSKDWTKNSLQIPLLQENLIIK